MVRLLTALPVVALAVTVVGACASGGRSGASTGDDGAAGSSGSSGGYADDSGSLLPADGSFGWVDGSPIGSLSIVPSNPVVDVNVVNGSTVSVMIGGGGTGSIAFQAMNASGSVLQATWSIDRGELG